MAISVLNSNARSISLAHLLEILAKPSLEQLGVLVKEVDQELV